VAGGLAVLRLGHEIPSGMWLLMHHAARVG
jgi:hypothetical protein